MLTSTATNYNGERFTHCHTHANLGAYTFPDETTIKTLSPGPLKPGCK
jgi:hypothetical protein